MAQRCPQCGYLVANACTVCAAGVPTRRISLVPQTLTGQHTGLSGKQPQTPASGKPRVWTREQILRAGQAWVQAHPGLLLQTEHLRARYGLPTITVIREHFGHISRYREVLGLPPGRAVPRRVSRTGAPHRGREV